MDNAHTKNNVKVKVKEMGIVFSQLILWEDYSYNSNLIRSDDVIVIDSMLLILIIIITIIIIKNKFTRLTTCSSTNL